MSTPDFFRSRLDAMVDLRHPLSVLARRLPWDRIEQVLAPKFAHQDRAARHEIADDLLGEHRVEFGGGVSNAGRPRLSIRLKASLAHLKNAFNLSDEELVLRWSQNLQYRLPPRNRSSHVVDRGAAADVRDLLFAAQSRCGPLLGRRTDRAAIEP